MLTLEVTHKILLQSDALTNRHRSTIHLNILFLLTFPGAQDPLLQYRHFAVYISQMAGLYGNVMHT